MKRACFRKYCTPPIQFIIGVSMYFAICISYSANSRAYKTVIWHTGNDR